MVRIDRLHEREFDEKLWPINLAILFLAGVVAGFVVVTSVFPDPATLDLTDPAVLHTGWGRLAAVALTAVAAMLAVLVLQRWLARRVLFCLLLGLIAHLWLGVYLHKQYMVVMAQRAEERQSLLSEDEEYTVVPDYHIEQISPSDEPLSFEVPVEPEPPRESRPQEVEKKAKEHEVVAERPAPVPQALPEQPPTPVRLDRVEKSVPLDAERASGAELSRQPTPDRPEPNEPIPQPDAPETAATPTPTLAARSAQAQRRVEQLPTPERAERMPDSASRPLASPMQRQATQEAPALSATAPRSTSRAAAVRNVASVTAEMPTLPATGAAPSPSRQANSVASAMSRSEARARAVAGVGASPAAVPSATADAVMPEGRRAALVPQASELAGSAARPMARASSQVRRPGPPMPTVQPGVGPVAARDSSQAMQPGRTSRAERQAAPGSATAARATGRADGALSTMLAQAAASLGRPKTHVGERPALESGGAGNPLARSARATPAVPTELPAADQTASTGTGAGTRPDMAVDASVSGPTRRMAGTTTELAVGRTSTDPPAGTVWGEQTAPSPMRRAATIQPNMAPTGSSGGGRNQLARSAFARDAADPAVGAPGARMPEATAAGSSAGGGATSPGESPSLAASSATRPGRAGGTPELGPVGAAGTPTAEPATGPGAAAMAARRSGDVAGAKGLLAMNSIVSVPKRSVGPLAAPAASMPAALDPTGAGPSHDAAARPSAGPAGSQTERRQAGPAVPVRQASGPGGLSDAMSPSVGIPSRRARPESLIVHNTPGRFMIDRAASLPSLDAALVKPPAAAFSQRMPGKRNEISRKYGATESSDLAVEQGLFFLLRCQFPDGRWAIDRLPQAMVSDDVDAGLGEMNSDTAATGLALLAFLGKGYTHTDGKYRNQVNAGLRWLIANQGEDGRLFSNQTDQTLYTQFYAHGIATIALGEAYGMTWDEQLREPLERAIQFTIDAQHPERGAWRYRPRQESDTSVSGWHLMALKSAQMAGLDVPTRTLAGLNGWLDVAQGRDGSRYRYNPYALDNEAQRQGRATSLAMTAEGLLMRLYLGRPQDHPEMVAGADYLRQNPPNAVEANGMRNVYYLYYATQVMFQMQGEYWTEWNAKLRPMLEQTQEQKGQLIGSWNPNGPITDRWGHAAGRLYVTAMNLLMLEVYYRHMPLFREIGE